MTEFTDSEIARFWSKVEVRQPDQCWLWGGSISRKRGGYGEINIKGVARCASRMSLMLKIGRAVVGYACHRCDNPPCVNPAHLYEGTPKQNSADAASKGRIGTWERIGHPTYANPASRLNADQVREIRKRLAAGELKVPIAKAFGVSRAAIHWIAIGKTWSHLP